MQGLLLKHLHASASSKTIFFLRLYTWLLTRDLPISSWNRRRRPAVYTSTRAQWLWTKSRACSSPTSTQWGYKGRQEGPGQSAVWDRSHLAPHLSFTHSYKIDFNYKFWFDHQQRHYFTIWFYILIDCAVTGKKGQVSYVSHAANILDIFTFTSLRNDCIVTFIAHSSRQCICSICDFLLLHSSLCRSADRL